MENRMSVQTLVVPSPGQIVSGELYTLDEVQARLKLGKAAMRSARRQGLRVRYFAGRAYVLGSDLVGFIAEHGKDEKDA
jgi:predicted deacetylase